METDKTEKQNKVWEVTRVVIEMTVTLHNSGSHQ